MRGGGGAKEDETPKRALRGCSRRAAGRVRKSEEGGGGGGRPARFCQQSYSESFGHLFHESAYTTSAPHVQELCINYIYI